MYLPLSASQILELLVSQGSDLSLFGQSLLERISGQVKEDAFISSSMCLAKLAGAKSGGKGKSSTSSASSSFAEGSSPLGVSRPGTSGFRKQSTFLARGGGGKRGHAGRGVSPPSSRKGFRK